MRFFRSLNEWVYQAERAVIALCFAFMAVTVFVHTLHGGIDDYTLATCGDANGCGAAWGVTAVLAVLGFALGWAAMRSRRREKKQPTSRAWLPALGIGIALAVVLQGFLWAFPRGWSWSSQLALSLLLWVGLLGTSVVTKERRHIHVEAVKKFLPVRLQNYNAFVANLLSSGLCGFVAIIGAYFVHRQYVAWAASAGAAKAAVLEQVPWLPEWVVALAVPVAFGLMSLRFIGHAFGSLRGEGGPVDTELIAAQETAAKAKQEDQP